MLPRWSKVCWSQPGLLFKKKKKKKKDDLDKENYRPVSVLSHVPKISEIIMYQQIEDFMKDKLSNLWADFRKNHSNQHCLMRMFENWKALWTEEVIYRLYMRTIYKFVKGLWHTKQQFINCQVRGLWIWYKIPILHKNLPR